MFEQTFVGRSSTHRPWTVAVSFAGQCVGMAILALIPLVFTDTLPALALNHRLTAPPPPPPPPPPPSVKLVEVPKTKATPRQFEVGKLFAPTVIPKVPVVIDDAELPPPVSQNEGPGVVGGVPGSPGSGRPGGPLGDILRSVPNPELPAPPPPPPVKQAVKDTPQRIEVGGKVQQAKLIHQPRPVYPKLARDARVQGVVKLVAVIGRDGTIANLEVQNGHPLLVPAALQAVSQWRYQPTLLNGQPVEVLTQIDVIFTLQ